MTSTLSPSPGAAAKAPFYKRRGFLTGAGLLAIPALALAWWLGSPLFLDTVVDEGFPTAGETSAQAPTADSDDAVEPAGGGSADTTSENTPADAAIPGSGSTPAAPADGEPGSVEVDDAESQGDEPASASPGTPVAVLTGEFAGADDFHEGSGTATVYELEDGSHVLRFEDFEVTNGPDLHVLISETDAIDSREALDAAGYEDLGKLKGNIGNQNYDLPAGFDLSGPVTITIYCDPFHVVFATATLSPAA